MPTCASPTGAEASLRVRDRRRSDRLDALEDRRAGRDVARAALPRDRPAARLVAEVVGVGAGDVDLGVRRQRQQAVGVLQQHLRLSATASRATARCSAEPTSAACGPVGERVLEQAERELLRQDAADRVVDPLLRDVAVVDRPGDGRDERAEVVRRHRHVEAGVHRPRRLVGVRAAGQLVDALPVADDEPVEAELALQHGRCSGRCSRASGPGPSPSSSRRRSTTA